MADQQLDVGALWQLLIHSQNCSVPELQSEALPVLDNMEHFTDGNEKD